MTRTAALLLLAASLSAGAGAYAQRSGPGSVDLDLVAPIRVPPPPPPPEPTSARASPSPTTPPGPDPTGASRVPGDGSAGETPGARDLRFPPNWTPPHATAGTAPNDEPFPVLHADRIEPNELLVLWPADQARQGIARIETHYGLRPAERVELRALGWTLGVYRFIANQGAAQLRWRLMQGEPRLLADFNTRYAAMGDARLYALAQIGAAPAGVGGAGARLGMLDGPLAAVSALRGGRIKSRSFLLSAEKPVAPGHGTAVAALIAGRALDNGFSGVAPDAQLHAAIVLRTRDQRDEATTRAILTALDWLVAERVQVINVSLGGPPNRLLAAAVYAVLARSTLIVAAAGNDGPQAAPNYPAAYPGVIAVTATDARGEVYRDANQGGHILLSAPGVDLWVPDEGGGRYLTGTSFAAALVAGALARLLDPRQPADTQAVQQHLCEGARDLGPPGRDRVFGCGLLQLDSTRTATSQ